MTFTAEEANAPDMVFTPEDVAAYGNGAAQQHLRDGAAPPGAPAAPEAPTPPSMLERAASAVTGSRPYQFLTDNGVGAAMGGTTDLMVNGRQHAIATGSSVAARMGRIGARSHVSSVAQPTPAGFDPAMTGRTVRPTAAGRALSGTGMNTFNGALGLIGVQQGASDVVGGLEDLQTAETGDAQAAAGLRIAGGATGAVSGGIGAMAAAGNATAIGGTAAAGMGTAVGAAGVVPVVGAVAGGAAAGIATANRGNAWTRDLGFLGSNEDMSGRDWSDWAAEGGIRAQRALIHAGAGETIGTVGGALATGAGSLVGTVGAGITGAAGYATDLGSLVASGWRALRGEPSR